MNFSSNEPSEISVIFEFLVESLPTFPASILQLLDDESFGRGSKLD